MNLCELPEGCISNILSLTTPKDACVLSLVATTFRSAAQSDTVWERFLPSDLLHIIGRSEKGSDFLRSFSSKKELYLYLCDNPILIDEDEKSFSVDKRSGKKCYMLSTRGLYIVWDDTPEYWRWIPLPRCPADMLSPGTTYGVYLVFALYEGTYGEYTFPERSVGISGFGNKTFPMCIDADAVRFCCKTYPVCLDPDEVMFGNKTYKQALIRNLNQHPEYVELREEHLRKLDGCAAHYSKKRIDGWMEAELGQIFVNGREDIELVMSLRMVEMNTKGLAVGAIEIRPKHI